MTINDFIQELEDRDLLEELAGAMLIKFGEERVTEVFAEASVTYADALQESVA